MLDLNADRGLILEDDNMVTTWTNQVTKGLSCRLLYHRRGAHKDHNLTGRAWHRKAKPYGEQSVKLMDIIALFSGKMN